MPVQLKPHQQTAVDALGNGNILRGDPGVGKSFTALAYFYTKECGGVLNDWGSVQTPKDIYIITTAKKRNSGDWQKDAYKLGLMEDREISVAGIKVTVDSWNNIEKYEEVVDAFFIFDEQKVAGSGKWSKSFLRITKRNRWIVLSATPGDVWMDYVPIFVANGFYKNRTEFVREHVVYATWVKFPKVERYTNVGRLVRHQNSILVEMRYKRHTTRHLEFVIVDHDAETLEKVSKKRWHVYEQRPLRDVAELFSVARKVVNSDSSRQSQIRKLLQKHPRLIVFYNFDYELELLRTLVNTPSEGATLSQTDSSSRDGQSLTPEPQMSITNDSAKTSELSSTMSSVEGHSNSSGTSEVIPTSPSLEARRTLTALRDDPSRTRFKASGLGDPTTSSTSGHNPQQSSWKSSDSSSLVAGTTSSSIPDPSSPTTGPESDSLTQTSKKDAGSSDGSTSFAVAEWNGHKHEPIPDTDSWVYLVQYRAGAEAWNCTDTDAMVFHSMTYSYKDFEQSQGRIDRLNTPYDDLYYFVLCSDSWIDKAIRKALNLKQNFNESRMRAQIEAGREPLAAAA